MGFKTSSRKSVALGKKSLPTFRNPNYQLGYSQDIEYEFIKVSENSFMKQREDQVQREVAEKLRNHPIFAEKGRSENPGGERLYSGGGSDWTAAT